MRASASPHRIHARRVAPAGWWFDALLVIAFAVLTYLLRHGHLLRVDLAVRNWSDDHQPTVAHDIAALANRLGQGGFFTSVCGLLGLFLCFRRHSVRPILPVIAAFVMTSVTLSILKDWTDRAAPHANTDPIPIAHPELFGSGGVSYPSGHLGNALVWYGTLALLLTLWVPRRWLWVLRIAPPVILSITTVYLGYHWFTDTVGGLLVGSFLWRLIARTPWDDIPLGSWLTKRGLAAPALERLPPPTLPVDPGVI